MVRHRLRTSKTDPRLDACATHWDRMTMSTATPPVPRKRPLQPRSRLRLPARTARRPSPLRAIGSRCVCFPHGHRDDGGAVLEGIWLTSCDCGRKHRGSAGRRPVDSACAYSCRRRSARAELVRSDDEAEASGRSAHTGVDRDEPALRQSCERDIVGVVGLGPPHLLRDCPCFAHQSAGLRDAHRRSEHPVEHRVSLLAAQLAAPLHRVQCRGRLDPHQRRGDQLKSAKAMEADRVCRCRDCDARVDDELQRPSRDSATAATQFGAGEPSSSVRHSGGSGSIGYISSRTSSSAARSTICLPWLLAAGRRPSRIQRRTVPWLLPTLWAASATVRTRVKIDGGLRVPGRGWQASHASAGVLVVRRALRVAADAAERRSQSRQIF